MNMKKPIKYLGIFSLTAVRLIGFLAFLVVILIIYFSTISAHHDSQTKNLLSQELTKLPTLPGCSEVNRQYSAANLDSRQSTWGINYTCQTTKETAYSVINAALLNQGFTSTTSATVSNKPTTGSIPDELLYQNSQFTADYTFLSSAAISANVPLSDSPDTAISSIVLNLSH